jgi:hypothetical protein
MKTNSAAAYNAFQRIDHHFPRQNSRLSRTQRMPVHIAKGRLQQLYNKTFETNVAMLPEQTVPSSLARLSAKTGLLKGQSTLPHGHTLW